MSGLTGVVPLTSDHDTARFDSGAPELDRWLRQHAIQADARDTARVYVVADKDGIVVGYCALVGAEVSRDVLTSRAAHGLPGRVPAILLGKLAVDTGHRNDGIGKLLLGHAARSALEVRRLIGVRLLVAHARDEAARDWYVSQGMQHLADEMLCYVRLKDLVPGA